MLSTLCHATKKEHLESILKWGLVPGVASGQSGATELQMSPVFPFDYALPLGPVPAAVPTQRTTDY
eukprot:2014897-Lingulodinium_polyedra.AAC.1